MKTLKCDFEEKGETFEKWMNALKPHYSEKHMNIKVQKADITAEEKMADMKKWMEDNKVRFHEKPETN